MHLLLYAACAADPLDTGKLADTAFDSAADSDTGGTIDTSSMDLNGTPPGEALALTEFTATNMDGSPRSGVDLVGHPTIMWFYPAAATGG